jgi:PAS domain S-box-containing protein
MNESPDEGAGSALVADLMLIRAVADQADEPIFITDTTPAIRYANPAAVRSTGYALEELLGQNPRIFKSDVHDAEFYEAMWSVLVMGQPWRGVMVNRGRNGRMFEVLVTIAPVFDRSGALVAYVSTQHDQSVERRLQSDISQWRSDRGAMAQLMNHVRSADSIEGTASAFCQAATDLDGIDAALTFLVHPDGLMTLVAGAGLDLPASDLGQAAPPVGLDDVEPIMTVGPWCRDLSEPVLPAVIGEPLMDALRELGVTATGYVGFRWEGRLVGLVVVATKKSNGVLWLEPRLGALDELGSFAGSVMGHQSAQYTRQRRIRLEVQDIIDNRRFHPVFQPVVNTRTEEITGYEALTRFEDGRRPDVRVADAHSVGLGSVLEAAMAAIAVEAARHLPPELWLGLNFSAGAILDGSAADVVTKANRAIVIEITEHAPIESYAAVRKSIRQGGDILISVDDAGAGFASLRHVLELAPDIVKLDIGLIRGIDSDPARQALAAGMCHFGIKTGTTMIAEGVETQAEAEVVRELGVELAQGYLFGRPEPLEPATP